jgi:hypothetical protein
VKRPNPLPWGWPHVGYNRGRSTHLPCRPYFVLGEGQNDGLANGKHRQMTATLVEAKGNRNAAVEIAELMRKASTCSYTNPATCTNKKTQSHYWSIAQCSDVCANARLCTQPRQSRQIHPEQGYPLAASLTKRVLHVIYTVQLARFQASTF